MSRVPTRLRLTLAFVLVMAVVLAGTGLFLYLRLGSALNGTIDQSLKVRAADIATLAQQADTGLRDARNLQRPATGFAQVLGPKGSIIDATPGVDSRPLLSTDELQFSRRAQHFFAGTVGKEPVRLLAMPATGQGQRLVVVVGASLEPRTTALADLRRQLLLGGPAALLLASLASYLLAAAALRPVERMSERAATISAASPGRRLPVPRADDEIARLGVRLNEMLARLEATLERERTLVANASHELRTPLALMKTEIELALAEPESAPALAAALRSAGAETDRLSQLADDLLLLARVDAGTLPLRRSQISVRTLLETTATRFRRRADDADREITVACPPTLTLLADRGRLEQALGNLVENALRHGNGAVGLEAAESNGFVELHVTDQGEGFPPGFLPQAFERFSHSDRSLGSGGAGLGLAIVAAIAHAHGGGAIAANAPVGGAAVTLRFPVRAPASSEAGDVRRTNRRLPPVPIV